ncbi:apoptosis-inducing factor 2-like [Stylophora pistillata]|uniref:Ferroptosis suppressor protein 1 n=1 Tax=Stylophora pistillata TaxID=50429 RepID=A0A2B4SVL3_STYPI|nr:apoptosis-inducing factor 2-like [Stylophora pistillata]PFX32455.1 Apoptosis-inducing factor 2 [Stylophora pistillata]
MFAARLRNAAPFLSAGIAAGSAVLLGYHACYGTAVHARDENVKSLKDTHVVVVGGGYGGIAAAKKLKDQCKVTLIDARDAFHHNMGAQRSSVESGFAKKCFISYGPTFGESFKQGKVVSIDLSMKTVTLETGEKIAYDDLVLATGTGGPFPAKIPLDTNKDKAIERYEDYTKLVKDAMKIGVVGGGAVGVEIAGDIMEDYKDKADVYLIHPRENLVNEEVNETFQSTIKAKLESLGVTMVLGERVMNMDEVKGKGYQNVMLVTDKGRQMKVDLVIPCTGLKVNTEAYRKSLGGKMNRLGRLNVDDFLQVKDVSDVYAIGDCNDVPEIKLAYGAETQGKYIADNLKLKHEGKAMKPYNVNKSVFMVLCCGRSGGAAQVWRGWVFGDWFASKIKGQSVFTPMQWKNMGQKMPED